MLPGVMVEEDKTHQWVTKFEDGREDSTVARYSEGKRLATSCWINFRGSCS